jgi:hypothetical protein
LVLWTLRYLMEETASCSLAVLQQVALPPLLTQPVPGGDAPQESGYCCGVDTAQFPQQTQQALLRGENEL